METIVNFNWRMEEGHTLVNISRKEEESVMWTVIGDHLSRLTVNDN